ncbi:hypothetical protein HAX54_015888 [Datura stramonium]|uniref:Uncharacterized protein n=1 Tax=Datura stramonium TaxID=4076 RepID=A0ABS8RZJ9_DATST|nr:hypothetical protein [Datura stramonium]
MKRRGRLGGLLPWPVRRRRFTGEEKDEEGEAVIMEVIPGGDDAVEMEGEKDPVMFFQLVVRRESVVAAKTGFAGVNGGYSEVRKWWGKRGWWPAVSWSEKIERERDASACSLANNDGSGGVLVVSAGKEEKTMAGNNGEKGRGWGRG